MANQLANALSPYLRQHRDNPVDWREWTEETLAEARRLNRPILLSVGYAACHWCHVMAHECFADPRIAELMNRSFINIKVDREERPDIDLVYQQALALLGQPGGWPLTMFLAPDGEPIWGGTYFPPVPRYGRPGFPQVLERIAAMWENDRERLESNRKALRAALERLNRPLPGAPDLDLAQRAATRLAKEFDPLHGGLGSAPKFPQVPALSFLWRSVHHLGRNELRKPLFRTARSLCQGGIFDHLGGGFARYSVDERWLVPHFEKMLYDNGQLIELLAELWADSGEALFLTRLVETARWMERELLTEAGFASSLDADSEGEEGRFYLWTEEEIDAVLGSDAGIFKRTYHVTPKGNFEGRTILHRLGEDGLADPETEQQLARCRERLFSVREKRPRPARDDKVLADWNGLAIAGLAIAGRRTGLAFLVELAERAFRRVQCHLVRKEGLVHAWCHGKQSGHAFLDDHAQMIRAALQLYQTTFNASFLDAALRRNEELWSRFYRNKILHLTADEDPGLPVPPHASHDGPIPAGPATQMENLLLLSQLTGDHRFANDVERILDSFGGSVQRMPEAHPGFLSALVLRDRGVHVRITSSPGQQPQAGELHRAAARHVPPAHSLAQKASDGPPNPAPAATVCVGQRCLLPVTTVEALQDLLRNLAPDAAASGPSELAGDGKNG